LAPFFFFGFSLLMTKEPTLHIDFLCYHQQFIPQLAEFLWKEWARFYLPFNITNIEQVKADLRKNCNIDRVPITLIATINSELVGTVSFGNDDLPATPYQPWLMSLFVLPQFRGQGIAKQLIQRVIQLAKQLGYSTVYLWTEDKQEMYSRLGWKFFQETVYAWAKITIMTYDLTSVT